MVMGLKAIFFNQNEDLWTPSAVFMRQQEAIRSCKCLNHIRRASSKNRFGIKERLIWNTLNRLQMLASDVRHRRLLVIISTRK